MEQLSAASENPDSMSSKTFYKQHRVSCHQNNAND